MILFGLLGVLIIFGVLQRYHAAREGEVRASAQAGPASTESGGAILTEGGFGGRNIPGPDRGLDL